jgi:hypothetical protein
MKGKNLYMLIKDLDKSEKHKILNTCKRSGDKRHKLLYTLIKKSPKQTQQFQNLLGQISDELFEKQVLTEKDGKEKDKIVRRFVDFSVKEVEQLKLRELLSGDQLTRNYLLAKIYRRGDTPTLFRSYLNKTRQLADKENDPWIISFCLDHDIVIKSQSQKKRDQMEVRDLLISKNNLIQSEYHNRLSEVYYLLSGLFLNDKDIVNELENLMLEDSEIDALVKLSAGNPVAIEYKIAQSRFNFEDEEKLNRYIGEAEALIEKCSGSDEEIEKQKKRISFLKVLDGFHYGAELKALEAPMEYVLQINKKYQYRDSLSGFYHVFLQLLDGVPVSELSDVIDAYETNYFEEENQYMIEFLRAYGHFMQNEYKAALMLLNNLSYAPNFYIAIWSRLLEIRIHIEKENFSLCESLVERANRQMNVNKGKLFTYNSNAGTLMNFCRLLNVRTPKIFDQFKDQDKNISPFHKGLNDWVEEQIAKQ